MGEALRLAADAPVGRLVFLPYLQGERTPVWDPTARGLFLGLTAGTTRGEMARAVLEGGAFSVRHMIESLEKTTGRGVTSLPSVGGGTRSALWNRIRADVLQRPLEVLRFQETAALGAALMAGVGAGVYDSEAAAVAAAIGTRAVDRVEPDPSRAAVYDRLYRAYREAYLRTRARDARPRLSHLDQRVLPGCPSPGPRALRPRRTGPCGAGARRGGRSGRAPSRGAGCRG